MLGQTYFDDQQITKVEVEKKTKKEKATNKKGKKQKYENIMKTLPPSCFSCAAHPTQYLRLIPEPNPARPTCKSCGFKLSGKLGYLICSKIASCYVLCSSCKVCSNNHFLKKMLSIKHLIDNQLYAKNQFKCHGCDKEKQVDPVKGVWHCHACSFSICSDCIEKTEQLWQQKNVSSDEEDNQQNA